MPQSQLEKVFDGIGGAALMGVHILLPFLHGWRVRWGASDAELARAWLGDELVPHPRGGFTHAITIFAPLSQVYPWMALAGRDKGGFYSYEFLENVIRFISCWRVDYPPGFKSELMFGRWLLEPVASVMDFKMLKGLRRRAETVR